MRVVRSNSPEGGRIIASTQVKACWGWSALSLIGVASLPGLLIALVVSFAVSVRAAVWVGVPIVVVWGGYVLWRGRSPRLNWVLAASADRVCVRLFARRGRKQADVEEPEIIELEASEIASMSIHTIELFLHGPKPKVIEWLVIEPASTIKEAVSHHIRTLQCGMSPNTCGLPSVDADRQIYVGSEQGPLTIEWKWCRPALRTFLQHVSQQCPSIAIGPEKCSELDLNGTWNGWGEEPNAQQRLLLVQAVHLGFGRKCAQLLNLYRRRPFPTFQMAAAYLVKIEREEPETEHSVVSQ